ALPRNRAATPFSSCLGEFGYNRARWRRQIRELLILAGALALLTIYFFLEVRLVERRASSLRYRIAVTGTRGKSTVTRLIAASLREAGISVLAKTTGSLPVLILPDGTEEIIKRPGLPTILESKRVLKRASVLGAEALVAELMSIQPECLRVESQKILQPQILVITNTRLDHREEMGWTKPDIAGSLSVAIPAGATVFILDCESRPEFEDGALKRKARIFNVRENGKETWAEQIQTLALAVASSVGLPTETSLRGMAKAAPDFGGLKIWEAKLGAASWLLISAFAANEPESSGLIINYLRRKIDFTRRKMVGILNFRSDRGDRTQQWLEATEQGFFSGFDQVYVVGAHIHSLRLRKNVGRELLLTPLGDWSPASIMDRVAADSKQPGILVGLGNVGGLGAKLIEHWGEIARPYAI
ncbi:MAG: poly-gamma-glutamate synthase PgsB, partial [Acidobacteriota bacterium]